jgi:hypothetical protein
LKSINNNKKIITKIPFYFSIDLEDISHDILYYLTADNSLFIKEKSILKSYEKTKVIIEKFLGNKKITFFTTGILAKKFPDIIKQISLDGHEIACHHYFHDRIYNKNQIDFARELDLAINEIEKASGHRPIGYRAPMFSINHQSKWAYEEISKRFKYDSSFRTTEKIDNNNLNNIIYFKNHSLFEFYVYEKKFFLDIFKMKSGGSFFRLFTKKMIKDALEETHRKNHIPLIYLHPYDFLTEKEFWLSLSDLKTCKNNKKYSYWMKQNLWHKLGNKTVEDKLEYITKYFEHSGKMCDHEAIN